MKKKAIVYIWPKNTEERKGMVESLLVACGYTQKKLVLIKNSPVWKCE